MRSDTRTEAFANLLFAVEELITQREQARRRRATRTSGRALLARIRAAQFDIYQWFMGELRANDSPWRSLICRIDQEVEAIIAKCCDMRPGSDGIWPGEQHLEQLRLYIQQADDLIMGEHVS